MGAIAYMNDVYPAGATSARDSVYDNTNTGLPANVQGAIDQTTNNIGQIEVGDNAVYNHAAGETFIWKGQFVKVGSTAIEVGSAISSKVSPTTISAILSELNSNKQDKILYDGRYSFFGIPFNAGWGGMFLFFNNPIPANQRDNYNYSLNSDIALQGKQESIVINVSSSDIVYSDGTINISNTLGSYFTSTGARYASLSALVSDNASISGTVIITHK